VRLYMLLAPGVCTARFCPRSEGPQGVLVAGRVHIACLRTERYFVIGFGVAG
jgi:hypothetical protein